VKFFFCTIAFLVIFRPAFPYLEYALNYDYIVNVLCVNKDKPEMQCNGKCHLKQALTEASNQETDSKKEKPVKQTNIPLLFFETQVDDLHVHVITQKDRKTSFFRPGSYAFQYSYSLLRPPITT
jgi:hypothetical protein